MALHSNVNIVADKALQGCCLLQGMYLEAFRRVFDILEDSGWQLVREGEEEELNSLLADLPDLPYMKQI